MFIKLIRWYFKVTNKSPTDFEMVKYWKTGEGVGAKLTKDAEGRSIMVLEGEKYPIRTFPRGHILFGPLSKLKHEIKNQIFNESWQQLEEGRNKQEIITDIKTKLFGEIWKHMQLMRFDMMPLNRMNNPVQEIHRAWTKVSPETWQLRDYLCMILQEDDSYCFRVQWLAEWFGWFMKRNPVKAFDYALAMLEHGEVVGDMKERQRLLRRILMLTLEDKGIRSRFIALFREIDWKKVRMSKGDKYHFRAKYFKVDLKYLEY